MFCIVFYILVIFAKWKSHFVPIPILSKIRFVFSKKLMSRSLKKCQFNSKAKPEAAIITRNQECIDCQIIGVDWPTANGV